MPPSEFAAHVAIDWADKKHYWQLAAPALARHEQGELDNTLEAIDLWAAGLQARFSPGPVAVCLDQSRGALVYKLTKYAHLVLYPVHPATMCHFAN